MRKIALILSILLCIALACPAGAVDAADMTPSAAIGGGADYSGSAKAVLLYERNTETLVYAYNADVQINPSGLVKMMTALLVLEHKSLDDVVTLTGGSTATVRELLYCIMVESSYNDAATALAGAVAGSPANFVELMNSRAATIGCVGTNFANASGVKSSNQYSTAGDLALITLEALKNEQFQELFETVNYRLTDGTTLSTTNLLMNPTSTYCDDRVTGGKAAKASDTDCSVICTARDESCSYLCVVISAGSSKKCFTEASSLLDLAFDGFSIQQVLSREDPYALYGVENGQNDVVASPDEDVYALLPNQFDKSLLRFVPTASALTAPVTAGEEIGSLQVYYNGIPVAEVALLARHSVAVKGQTISQTTAADSGTGILGRVLKWAAIALVGLVLVGVVALLVLRRVNQMRHKKKKRTEERL